jgi:hypothetical protein
VLKKGCAGSEVGGGSIALEELFLAKYLRHRGDRWSWRLAEEADEPFDILRGRCHEELLANKL